MIRNILTVLLVFAGALSFAQSTTQNYVKETIYKEGLNPWGIGSLSTNDDFITTTYYDGFGRPIQQVQHNASPVDNKNIVTHIEYEKNVGQTKEYLPFTSDGSSVNFISNARQATLDFYTTTYNIYTEDPYSETRLENAPNPRVLESGAPGTDWHIDTTVPEADRHTIRYSYAYNSANEVKKFNTTSTWNSSRELYTSTITENGFYPANSLKKTVVKNENWKTLDGKNNTVEEFKGVDGKVLLKRAYNNSVAHDTYYVYDFYGNLSYVIPPLANGSIAGANLNNLCYQYLYDDKNRLVEKKLPQKGWEFIVYDKADRIVMTGPAKNPFDAAAVSGWIITKYDNMGRTLYTGFYNGHTVTSANRKAIKTTIYAQTDNNESKHTANTTIDGVTTRYTNTKFPTSFNLLTVNYFDNYTFPGAPSTFPNVEGVTPAQNVKGLATGSWTRVITTTSERNGEVSYTLYNNKYQPLRINTTNYLGGYTQTDNALTFRGLPTKTVTTHKRTSAAAILNVTNNYTYDNKERLKTHTQQINGGAEELIAENVYDELGKLNGKKVGNTLAAPLQDIAYYYNIRGWLTRINTVNYSSLDIGGKNGLFNYSVLYNYTLNGDTSKPQYNGNISSVAWRTQSDDISRGYGFDYDHLNRLNYGSHLKATGSVFFRNYNRDGQYAEDLTYDKNGNITTLKRYGQQELGQPIETDDLTYTYTANQLQSVTDATNNSAGFNDGNKTGADYTYDAFGNMLTDKNKGITGIKYNHLNLPTEITFATGKIAYTYDATGTKMKKVVTPTGGAAQTMDYLHGFEYENNDLKTFPHPEGYVKKEGANYIYHYIYRDHLGNNRLVYADLDGNGVINPATEIVEENNYYPFGLKHQGYNDLPGVGYKYKFLNKEYESSFGLNVTETDFRQYDAAIGRFNVMDALSELAPNYTPYRYGFNNPIFWQDKTGLFESWDAANAYSRSKGLKGSDIRYNREHDSWEIVHGDKTIFQIGDQILSVYELEGEWVIEYGIAGGGGSHSNSGFVGDMAWSNGILGGLSTANTFPSGYLKHNELWHKTKTRGYSFAGQDKWKNSGAKYWRGQQVKGFEGNRNIGKALTKAGGILVATDIVLSGEVRPSHLINGVMLGASTTGVGSIVAGIWFIADYGTGTYNYIFTQDGFRTLSDVIDQSSWGQTITIDMYNGFY